MNDPLYIHHEGSGKSRIALIGIIAQAERIDDEEISWDDEAVEPDLTDNWAKTVIDGEVVDDDWDAYLTLQEWYKWATHMGYEPY